MLHEGADGPSVEVSIEAETSRDAIDKAKAELPEGRRLCHIRRRNYPGLPDEPDERTDITPPGDDL